MVVSKDIHTNYPYTPSAIGGPPQLTRVGTIKTDSLTGEEESTRPGGTKSDFTAKTDNADNMFVEDVGLYLKSGLHSSLMQSQIVTAISYHFGENLIRARFTEYVIRFVRLASKYEEELTGSTTIGFPTVHFSGSGEKARLGSGMMWTDEMSGPRELQANASRIDGFRGTDVYKAVQIVRISS